MSKIRVLLADDSVAVRRLLSQTLEKAGDLEVVGAAQHGREALEILGRTNPDLILLDVEMPIMDGIDTLKEIRRRGKATPVLMFSSLTVSGAEATLEALACGANDFVAKPTAAGNVSQAVDYINKELVPKIRQWAVVKQRGPAVRIGPAPEAAPKRTPKSTNAIEVVVIGSSTGGPNALATVMTNLPANLGAAILIVQHMPVLFTRLLAERLNKFSPLKVKEAKAGDVIRRNEVLIAPGDFHMTVRPSGQHNVIALNQAAPENSCRPAVDVLFRSAASVYGGRALGVVLTGMGKDGLHGAQDLSKAGATLIAQDKQSCVVWGMPRAVSEAGLADAVVPLSEIHTEITRLVQHRTAPVLA